MSLPSRRLCRKPTQLWASLQALRKSQKVYSIWFHRKWVIEHLFQELTADPDTLMHSRRWGIWLKQKNST